MADKPAPKDVDKALFRNASEETKRLQRQSRKELRFKQRRRYKELHINVQEDSSTVSPN